ncbi:type II toxin-antitoxin system VapC family toxin [Asticcacaulis sp. AND118]|uniref:type II toxin-antitoxin system VapC family toxin n=1 Tax=Asticcacaulis sp. AND118 TaxID=2840468 RepID=UPI001CFFED20|nr:type II toxin-antitoxin system VapC family toxin [Asticcacaulis sp. AND118]UDF05406.1 type II toxin-antitoxin system VapC family toxin [Asticcacaulis sp. AND118]
MSDYILDSSAVLALLFNEAGADRVQAVLPDAMISAVNFSEVIAKLCEKGLPSETARQAVEALGIEVVAHDVEQAFLAGALRLTTRALGLSLGDRACLALAKVREMPVLTADAAWQGLTDFQVVLIR